MHRAHLRHVDDHASVVCPEPGPAVPAAAHREIECVLTGEVHSSYDVGDLLGLHDRQRMPVEHPVVHRPGLVVAFVRGGDHLRAHLITQGLNGLGVGGRPGYACHFLTPSDPFRAFR